MVRKIADELFGSHPWSDLRTERKCKGPSPARGGGPLHSICESMVRPDLVFSIGLKVVFFVIVPGRAAR